jgi:hypothetical protein
MYFNNVVFPERLAPISDMLIPPFVGSTMSKRFDSKGIPLVDVKI